MARGGKGDNGKGLLIDTWYWEYPGIDAVGAISDPEEQGDSDADKARRLPMVRGQKVPLQLRLRKELETDGAPPQVIKSVSFWVGSEVLGIGVSGTDIEILRYALWGQLEKRFEIHWEEYRVAQIAPARAFGCSSETGFSLGQSTVWKGTAHDGTLLLREISRHDRTKRMWDYKPWPTEYINKQGRTLACIPATEKNLLALEEFCERIRTLQKRLAESIRPEHILSTLDNLAALSLLPAPDSPHPLECPDDDE